LRATPGHTIAQTSHSQQTHHLTHHQDHLAPFSNKFRRTKPSVVPTMGTLHNQAQLTCTHARPHLLLAHPHPRAPGQFHTHNSQDQRHPRYKIRTSNPPHWDMLLSSQWKP
ncbi:hypothetical protein DYB28_013971, partial [Aphanomyces astaci]